MCKMSSEVKKCFFGFVVLGGCGCRVFWGGFVVCSGFVALDFYYCYWFGFVCMTEFFIND